MELNERKMKILQAIIGDYLSTAEPVGSRTISKNYDLGISPATIRNEMSDLEELGFIVQPHTSAGRIPSDKGYRYYVDSLVKLPREDEQPDQFVNKLLASADRIEDLLKNIAKLLAKETNYATLVSTPKYKSSKIKNLQLVGVEDKRVLVVVVTDGNIIKNYMIDLDEGIEQTMLNRITYVLNEHLYGLTLEEINLPLIKNMHQYTDDNQIVISKVLDVIFHTIKSIDDSDVYFSGTTNILKFPEFNDINKALELIDVIEKGDKNQFLVDRAMNDDEHNINIKIGEEIEVEEMIDCSIITTSYHIGGKKVGAIAVIGPKRMDYNKTVHALKCLQTNVEKILNRNSV
ncbi:MAG: heat-inducible transcriptional repressor HrcA [Vallitaleaceae bacterium]|nr:heat-inducible transcriptional repressor HrcA [Vallitaleaceae bacterium]